MEIRDVVFALIALGSLIVAIRNATWNRSDSARKQRREEVEAIISSDSARRQRREEIEIVVREVTRPDRDILLRLQWEQERYWRDVAANGLKALQSPNPTPPDINNLITCYIVTGNRSEERRVGKEC